MKIAVVTPNWNGADEIADCLDSLKNQSQKHTIVVVDNGSVDNSIEVIKKYQDVVLLEQPSNLGFAGGVNMGIRWALDNEYDFVALLNNDAIADKDWLKNLATTLQSNSQAGIVTSKIRHQGDNKLDSTGDYYTTWFLPYPRGRNEEDHGQYDKLTDITAASGGASIYRCSILKEIGLFDEDFFAYYEDVDISLRAQLAGWKVLYEPTAIVRHKIGGTSGKLKGFTTYQTVKNLPLLYIKNVPGSLIIKYWPKFLLAHTLFIGRAIFRGHAFYAVKGVFKAVTLTPKKIIERQLIQQHRKLSAQQFDNMLVHDLPPNAKALRKLRNVLSLGIIK